MLSYACLGLALLRSVAAVAIAVVVAFLVFCNSSSYSSFLLRSSLYSGGAGQECLAT